MPVIEIPDEHVAALRQLAKLTPEESQALVASLGSAEPCLSGRQLVKQIKEAEPALAQLRLTRLTEFLFAIYGTITEDEAPVDLVIDAFRTSIDESEALGDLTDQQRTDLKQRINELLRLGGPIKYIAKARNVGRDHEKTFSKARILSDLRPVFSDDLSQPPLGMVVLHTLKLVYYRDFEPREIFVTMDSGELTELGDMVKRAKEKELALQTTLKQKELLLIQ